MKTLDKVENQFMQKFADQTEFQHKVGDTIEGNVIAKDMSSVFIDIHPRIGIIYGREFLFAKDILRKIKIGDSVSAKVISIEDENGYIDLSLQEARNALIWKEAEESIKSGKVYMVAPKDANRGGLIVEWNGLRGFLPASQLSAEHYPKALNGNKESILNSLKKLIDEKISVKIITVDEEEGRIIFSEKGTSIEQKKSDEIQKSYKIGDIKSGIIIGITDFGVFVKIDDNIEGLVHISQMEWGLVDDPHSLYSIGDTVNVKISDISEEGKYSLSIKELKENPWEELAIKYGVNHEVRGVIIKYNSHGAFASIEEGVTGLIHISNYGNEDELRNELIIGKSYDLVISVFEPKEQRLTMIPKDRFNYKKTNNKASDDTKSDS